MMMTAVEHTLSCDKPCKMYELIYSEITKYLYKIGKLDSNIAKELERKSAWTWQTTSTDETIRDYIKTLFPDGLNKLGKKTRYTNQLL